MAERDRAWRQRQAERAEKKKARRKRRARLTVERGNKDIEIILRTLTLCDSTDEAIALWTAGQGESIE